MAKSAGAAERIATLTTRLRDDVRFGELEFGEWLKLVDLQARYGATQHEIRRVLSDLKGEGLVEHKANAGFRVATPDTDDRAEMIYVRSVLERSTAPLIAAKARPKDIEKLDELAREFEASIVEKGRRRQTMANMAFHRYLYSIAGNQILVSLIHDLREKSHFGTTGRWRTVEGLYEANGDHMRIVDAIRRRDPNELERLIVQHITSF